MRDTPAQVFGIDAGVIAGMRAMGASPQDIAAAEANQVPPVADEVFEIYAENERSLLHWLAICTQWVRVGMEGIRTGLNYAGVVAYLDTCVPRRIRKTTFADMRLMERAVLVADQELREQERR